VSAPTGDGASDEVTVPTTTPPEWEATVNRASKGMGMADALPDSWEERADDLLHLLIGAAIAKGLAARAHAQAWLAADGPAVQREQVARLAASGAVLAADTAKARVEAYRLLLDATRLADLA
jgi:hypothetical protein